MQVNVVVKLDGLWTSMLNSGYQPSQLFNSWILVRKFFSNIQESLCYAQINTLWNTACFSIVRLVRVNITSLTMNFQEFMISAGPAKAEDVASTEAGFTYPSSSQLGQRLCWYLLKVTFLFPMYKVNVQGRLHLAQLHFEKGSCPSSNKNVLFSLACARTSVVASCFVDHQNVHC